jgi:hypothetical protein
MQIIWCHHTMPHGLNRGNSAGTFRLLIPFKRVLEKLTVAYLIKESSSFCGKYISQDAAGEPKKLSHYKPGQGLRVPGG